MAFSLIKAPFIFATFSCMRLLLCTVFFCAVFFCSLLSVPLVQAQVGKEIEMRGSLNLTATIEFEGVRLRGAGLSQKIIKQDGAQFVLTDRSQEIFATAELSQTEAGGPSRVTIKGKDGLVVHFFQSDGAVLKILNPDQTVAYRLEIDSSGFTVFNNEDVRIASGLAKDAGFVIIDELGKKEKTNKEAPGARYLDSLAKPEMTTKGAKSLREVSYFAFPLKPEYQALLWAVYHARK